MAECSEIEAGGEIRTIKDPTARKAMVYSTDEIDTKKTWIDGKPIYRKVFKTNTPQLISSGGATTLNFANVAELHIESLIFSQVSLSTGNMQHGNAAYYSVDLNSGSIVALPRYGVSYNVDTVILEYTKTTS